jgi:AAA domain
MKENEKEFSPPKERRMLTGASLWDYSQRAIPDEGTLLGRRWLCRGGGAFIVGQSGIGKSVLAVQLTIELACGRESFGIAPAGPLRVFVVQAEDDEGDVIEMARIVDYLSLDEVERDQVKENTHIEQVNDLCGKEFIETIDGFLTDWKPDLLIINPYTAYLGADNKDDKENTLFLRNYLNPVLSKHQCACIIIHHTPKTNHRGDTSKWSAIDWAYGGAGAAVLTNWARAMVVIDSTDTEGVFKFIAAKRGKRTGWESNLRFFSHSAGEDRLLWAPATETQIQAAQKTKPTEENLLELIPYEGIDPILQDQVIALAKTKLNMGERKTRGFLTILEHSGEIRRHTIKREKTKGAVGYTRERPPVQCVRSAPSIPIEIMGARAGYDFDAAGG